MNNGEPSYAPRRPAVYESIVLRGLRHRIARWGPSSAAPIVLLHGFLDAADTWQFLVDELPADWSFVGLDWRGFGGSDWQPGGYWFADYLADLDTLLDAVAPGGPAQVIGHSMGGNVAALYNGIRPGRLAWLVNLEGLGLPQTAPDEAPARYARWLDENRTTPRQTSYTSPDELARYLRSRNRRLTAPRAAFIAKAWTRESGGRWRLAADPRHRIVNPSLYRREESEACWRRGTAPMLMLLGSQSDYRVRLGAGATEEYFHSVFAHLELGMLEGVGHMMHHEDPAAVARCVERFVAAQVPDRS